MILAMPSGMPMCLRTRPVQRAWPCPAGTRHWTHVPGGGWRCSLCEILQPKAACMNGVCCFLPCSNSSARWCWWAPYVPFWAGGGRTDAHALLWLRVDGPERLWAAEQVLRCAGVAALLVWLPKVRANICAAFWPPCAQLLFVMRPDTARSDPPRGAAPAGGGRPQHRYGAGCPAGAGHRRGRRWCSHCHCQRGTLA